MSKLTNCPNCGAKWSYEEQETDSCDNCEYPNNNVHLPDLMSDPHFEQLAESGRDAVRKEILGCSGSCGMNYCDDNGCLEKKHILAEGVIPLKHPDDELRN